MENIYPIMKFGNQLKLRESVLWKEFYLDYDFLKNLIKRIVQTKQKGESEKKEENTLIKVKKSSPELLNLFFELISKEIIKVDEWYIKVEAQCHKTIQELESKYSQTDSYELNDQIMVAQFSEKIISIKDFATLNHTAFIKIIKKYKKYLGEDDRIEKVQKNLSTSYFCTTKGLEGLEAKIHVSFIVYSF